jgi:hypothetical protein
MQMVLRALVLQQRAVAVVGNGVNVRRLDGTIVHIFQE